MVLLGKVAPITHPYLNTDDGESLRTPTPLVLNEPEDIVSLCLSSVSIDQLPSQACVKKIYIV